MNRRLTQSSHARKQACASPRTSLRPTTSPLPRSRHGLPELPSALRTTGDACRISAPHSTPLRAPQMLHAGTGESFTDLQARTVNAAFVLYAEHDLAAR